MKLVFFGSFQHYSALILDALIKSPRIEVIGVVTTAPSPQGRQKILTKNPVQQLAESNKIPVFTPDKLGQIPAFTPTPPQYFVTSGYGKLLPPTWLVHPTQGAVNLHFSLLPKFRGANPAEWAILLGETETGISLIKMSDKFDQGEILNQAKTTITTNETRESLYQKLYALGAKSLPGWLIELNSNEKKSGRPQGVAPTIDAYRFSRLDGFIDWQILSALMSGHPFDPNLLSGYLEKAYNYQKIDQALKLFSAQVSFIERAARALSGFPSLWTKVKTNKGDKRLKLISYNIGNHLPFQPLQVQLEGLPITPYREIKNQIHI